MSDKKINRSYNNHKNKFIIATFIFSFLFLFLFSLPNVSGIEWTTYGNSYNPYSHALTGGYNGDFNESYDIIDSSFGSEDIEPIAFTTSNESLDLIAVQDGSYMYILNQEDLSVYQEIKTGELSHSGEGAISFHNDKIKGIWDDKFEVYEYDSTDEEFKLDYSEDITNINSDIEDYSSSRCSSDICYFTSQDSTNSSINIIEGNDNYTTKKINTTLDLEIPSPYFIHNDKDHFVFISEDKSSYYVYDYDSDDILSNKSFHKIPDIKAFYPLSNGDPRIAVLRQTGGNFHDLYLDIYRLNGDEENSKEIVDPITDSDVPLGKIAVINYDIDEDNDEGEDLFISTDVDKKREIYKGNSLDKISGDSSGDKSLNSLSIADITGDGYGRIHNPPYFDFITVSGQNLEIYNPKKDYFIEDDLDEIGSAYACIPFLNQNSLKIDLACSGSDGTAIIRSNYSGVKPYVYDPIPDQKLDLNSSKEILIEDHFKEQEHFYIAVTVDGETYSFSNGSMIENFDLQNQYEDYFDVRIEREKEEKWTEGDKIILEAYDNSKLYDVEVVGENNEGSEIEEFSVQSGDYDEVEITLLIDDKEMGEIDYKSIDLDNYFDNVNDYEVYFDNEEGYWNGTIKDGETASFTFNYEDDNGTVVQEPIYNVSLDDGLLELKTNFTKPFSDEYKDVTSIQDPHITNFEVTGSNEISEESIDFETEVSQEYESGSPPSINNLIYDFELDFNESTVIDLDDHYSNFEVYEVYVNDEKIDSSKYFYDDNDSKIFHIAKRTGNRLEFNSYETEDSYSVEIELINDYGKKKDDFNVDVIEDSKNPYEDPEEEEKEEKDKDLSDSGLEGIVKDFINFFPEDLSTTQKLAYVFISLFLISLIFILVSAVTEPPISSLLLYLTAFIDATLIIFFIGIGYIPVGFVLIMVLILIAIAYFKFFRNTGGIQ